MSVSVLCNRTVSVVYVGHESGNSHLGKFRGSTTSHLLYSQLLELSLELIELLGEVGLVL